jgi:hypothetical protein
VDRGASQKLAAATGSGRAGLGLHAHRAARRHHHREARRTSARCSRTTHRPSSVADLSHALGRRHGLREGSAAGRGGPARARGSARRASERRSRQRSATSARSSASRPARPRRAWCCTNPGAAWRPGLFVTVGGRHRRGRRPVVVSDDAVQSGRRQGGRLRPGGRRVRGAPGQDRAAAAWAGTASAAVVEISTASRRASSLRREEQLHPQGRAREIRSRPRALRMTARCSRSSPSCSKLLGREPRGSWSILTSSRSAPSASTTSARLPIDAVPDITNVQVQINTQVEGALARGGRAPRHLPHRVGDGRHSQGRAGALAVALRPVAGHRHLRGRDRHLLGPPARGRAARARRRRACRPGSRAADGADRHRPRRDLHVDPRGGRPARKRPDGSPTSSPICARSRTGSCGPSCATCRESPRSTRSAATSGSTRSPPIRRGSSATASRSATCSRRSPANNANAGGGYIEHKGEQYLIRATGSRPERGRHPEHRDRTPRRVPFA